MKVFLLLIIRCTSKHRRPSFFFLIWPCRQVSSITSSFSCHLIKPIPIFFSYPSSSSFSFQFSCLCKALELLAFHDTTKVFMNLNLGQTISFLQYVYLTLQLSKIVYIHLATVFCSALFFVYFFFYLQVRSLISKVLLFLLNHSL